MPKILRSCLRMVFVWVACCVLVGFLVYRRMPVGGAGLIGGLIGGTLFWFFGATVLGIPIRIREWWLIRRALGGSTPEDGAKIAVIGTVRPAGTMLHAPFSGTPCMAYSYEVITPAEGEESSPEKIYEGFAMIPMSVGVSERQVRLLSFPQLDFTPDLLYGRDREVERRAKEFITETSFDSFKGKPINEAAKGLEERLAQEDGRLRYDEMRSSAHQNMGACSFKERLILPGETICAIGRYSSMRRALVSDPDALTHAITIRKGKSPESFAGKALRSIISLTFITMPIFAAICVIAFVAFHAMVPLDAAEQTDPSRRILWPEVRLERWLDREVRPRMQRAGMIDTQGHHLLDLCPTCAKGKMFVDGCELELTRAEHAGKTITLRGDPGAVVELTFLRWNVARARVNGRDVPIDWVDVARFDDGGRVTILSPDDTLRVHAAF